MLVMCADDYIQYIYIIYIYYIYILYIYILYTFYVFVLIVMCADEVYQENIYNPTRPFVSARKVTLSLVIDLMMLDWISIDKNVCIY